MMLMNWNPVLISVTPKSKRGVPAWLLTPTHPRSMPKNMVTRPFRTDRPLTDDTTNKPIRIRLKYSAAEKVRATSARIGENTIITMTLNTPPMAEHVIAVPRAFPASPFLVIG